MHRCDCSNFREMAARNSERVIDVAWGQPKAAAVASAVYPVDVRSATATPAPPLLPPADREGSKALRVVP